MIKHFPILSMILVSAYSMALPSTADECGKPAEQVITSPALYDLFPNYSEIVRTSFLQGRFAIYAARHDQSGARDQVSYLVTDAHGQTWHAIEGIVPNLLLPGVKLFDAGNNVFYKFEQRQSFRSVDGGLHWQSMKLAVNLPEHLALPRSSEHTSAIVIPSFAGADPSEPWTIFASFALGVPDKDDPARFAVYRELPGIYISRDGGDTWSVFSEHLRYGTIVAISPYNAQQIMSVAEQGVVYSNDGGSSWHPIPQEDVLETAAIGTTNTTQPEPTTDEERRYRLRILDQQKLQLFQVVFTAAGDTYLLGNKGLYRLRPHQSSWTWFNLGNNRLRFANSVAISPRNQEEIFVGTDAGIMRSKDGGCHFEIVLPSLIHGRFDAK